MKVLFCDLKFDYGKEKNGPNFIGNAFRDAIAANGNDVSLFYYDNYLLDPQPSDKLQLDLLDFASSKEPDLIFFSMFGDQFAYQTLEKLKSRFVTCAWFGDDTWRFKDYTARYAGHFTYCITTDKFSVKKYFDIGQKNVILSQWAAIDNHRVLDGMTDSEYLYEVSFVGGFNRYREWFVKRLAHFGIKVECFGRGWGNSFIDLDKMQRVFQLSKINLNLSNSLCHDIRFLFSNPFNLVDYMRYQKDIGQIKARNFEIPYYGGFQMTDFFPGIEDYFKIGEEIACFKDVEEAAFLIKYYLENDELRKEMALRASMNARANHGYANRFRDILGAVKIK